MYKIDKNRKCEELIGKCCKLWNNDPDEYVIGIVLQINKRMKFIYATEFELFRNARLATQEDFDKLMEVNK